MGQTTGVFATVKAVSWPVFWGSALSPIILSAVFTNVFIIAWRRVNRSDGNPPIKASKLFVVTLFLGAGMGAVAQWGMQELVAHMTGVAPAYKMIIVAAIFTPALAMALYTGARWYAKKKKWQGLYNFLSVKHDPEVDYQNSSDTTEFEFTANEENNDDTTPR